MSNPGERHKGEGCLDGGDGVGILETLKQKDDHSPKYITHFPEST